MDLLLLLFLTTNLPHPPPPPQLALNDVVGPGTCLHGGTRGWDKKVWEGRLDAASSSLTLTLVSPHGEEGFPGDILVSVTYTLGPSSLNLR